MSQRPNATLNPQGQGVACGQCKHPNSPDSRFCSGCGAPLWEPCLSCGTECNTSETFCGSCGTNLRESVASQIEAAEAALAKASELESRHRLQDAIQAVDAIRLSDDSRLQVIAKKVTKRREHLRDQRSHEADNVATGLERVRDMLEAHAYRDAIQMLEKLPASYRTKESERLLVDAQAKQQELDELKLEIRAAVKEKRISELAPAIRRILILQPDAESILRLAEQVRDRLLLTAKRQLDAHDYSQARDIAARIPDCAVDDNTHRLRKQIAEFLWLENDVQQSPIIDNPLIAIARRLATEAPNDIKNFEWCTKLLKVAAEKFVSDSKRFPSVAWAASPKRTQIGCKVEWLGGSERLTLGNQTVASNWKSEPGRYFVAAGLALQGIDISELPTNLLTVQRQGSLRQGLLENLSLGRRKQTTKRAWGLDIGDSSLKVVRLVSDGEQTAPVVDCCEIFPHRDPLSRPNAEGQRHNIVLESVQAFLAKYTIDKSDRICVSVPAPKVLKRPMELPDVNAKKLTEMVRYEAQQKIPIPLEELAWSYHCFADDSESDSSNELPNTLLMAAKQQDVQELQRLFDELELPLHIVQSEAAALFNFMRFEGVHQWVNQDVKEPTPIAILDVGAAATKLVIDHGGRPWIRSFGCGGDGFTSAAVQELQLTREQAELVKIEPTRIRRLSELDKAYFPKFAQLTDEVRRSLEAFTKETGLNVSHVFGIGGGFRLHGLFKYFRNGP